MSEIPLLFLKCPGIPNQSFFFQCLNEGIGGPGAGVGLTHINPFSKFWSWTQTFPISSALLQIWPTSLNWAPSRTSQWWQWQGIAFSLHCHRYWQCPEPTCFKVETKTWGWSKASLFSLWMTKLLNMENGEWPMLQCACLLVPSILHHLCFCPPKKMPTFHNFLALKKIREREREKLQFANGLFSLCWKGFCFLLVYFWTKRKDLYSFCLIFSMVI